MKRIGYTVLAIALTVSCSKSSSPVAPAEFVVPLTVQAVKGDPLTSTHLGGEHEVPARDTLAQGQAIMKVLPDGQSISYKVIASNIDNIVQSHIHVGAAGTNGPIVVFLFGPVPAGGGRHDGVLAEGTFTAANFIGPLTGQPFSALIAQMQAGNTYVNVHTNDGVGAPNSGPGDFPGGEIRGQVRTKDQ
jgi:hypothetical protein